VGAGRKFILLFVRAKWVFQYLETSSERRGEGYSATGHSFEKNPIRFLSVAQNGDLCFGYEWRDLRFATRSDRAGQGKIRIAVAGNAPDRQQTHLNDGVTEIVVSPNGKEIAFVVRVTCTSHRLNTAIRSGLLIRPAKSAISVFSYDGRKLIFAAEYDKPWSLYEASIVQPKDKEPYFFQFDGHRCASDPGEWTRKLSPQIFTGRKRGRLPGESSCH